MNTRVNFVWNWTLVRRGIHGVRVGPDETSLLGCVLGSLTQWSASRASAEHGARECDRVFGVHLLFYQLTPMRVMHRRTLMVRQRTIHAHSATRLGTARLSAQLPARASTW